MSAADVWTETRVWYSDENKDLLTHDLLAFVRADRWLLMIKASERLVACLSAVSSHPRWVPMDRTGHVKHGLSQPPFSYDGQISEKTGTLTFSSLTRFRVSSSEKWSTSTPASCRKALLGERHTHVQEDTSQNIIQDIWNDDLSVRLTPDGWSHGVGWASTASAPIGRS